MDSGLILPASHNKDSQTIVETGMILEYLAHTIHGTGIFTIHLVVFLMVKYGFHVGKYTSPMDGKGWLSNQACNQANATLAH